MQIFWTPVTQSFSHLLGLCDISSVFWHCHRLITPFKGVSCVKEGVHLVKPWEVGRVGGVSVKWTGFYVTRAPPPPRGLTQEVWSAFCHGVGGGGSGRLRWGVVGNYRSVNPLSSLLIQEWSSIWAAGAHFHANNGVAIFSLAFP